MMPGRDMDILADMSMHGWHVSGMSAGFLYRFEQGNPHAYDYAVDFVRDFSPEVQELFRIGGWRPVVVSPGWQILRAEAGTTPLYTDNESEAVTLSESRTRAGKTALVCAFVTVLFLALEAWFKGQGSEVGSTTCLVVAVAAASGFAFPFLPFIGYTISLWKTRAER